MFARLYTTSIAAAFTALAIVGASIPAVAKDNQAASYDACYSLAVERGSGPGKGGGTKEHSQHKAFMDQCMAGKIAVTPQARASEVNVPANAFASTVVSKRANGRPASAR